MVNRKLLTKALYLMWAFAYLIVGVAIIWLIRELLVEVSL